MDSFAKALALYQKRPFAAKILVQKDGCIMRILIIRHALCTEKYYEKKQRKILDKMRILSASFHKNHFPRAFSHSKVSVSVTREGVAGGITKECFSKARRCVSMLAFA